MSAPPDTVSFHNATSHAEGTNWKPCWFSACSALKGFSLQSQQRILSSTIDLLDGCESAFFCCPVELWDHGKAVLQLKRTPVRTSHQLTLSVISKCTFIYNWPEFPNTSAFPPLIFQRSCKYSLVYWLWSLTPPRLEVSSFHQNGSSQDSWFKRVVLSIPWSC